MADKTPIQAVICDAGGVLLFPDFDWLIPRFAEHGLEGLTRGRLHRAYYRTICALDLDTGQSKQGAAFVDVETRRWFFSRLLQGAGVSAEQAQRPALAVAELAAARLPRESDL